MFVGSLLVATSHAQWTVTNLHPAGANRSVAYGASGVNQVGRAAVGGFNRASLWSGTAASWVNLHPGGATYSIAHSALGAFQVGRADVGGIFRASLWSGTAASWVDLHAFVPSSFSSSSATGITTDGINYYISGYGFNSSTGRNEALLWTQPVPEPGPLVALAMGAVVLLRQRKR